VSLGSPDQDLRRKKHRATNLFTPLRWKHVLGSSEHFERTGSECLQGEMK
jgi:hypothetical protein